MAAIMPLRCGEKWMSRNRKLFSGLLLAVVLAAGLGWVLYVGPGARPGEARAGRPAGTITLYGYSVIEEVCERGIFPAFKDQWKQVGGEDVQLISSFASLGQITSDLSRGAPADLAILSAEVGLQELADAGVISLNRQARLPHSGILGHTPVIIAVRPGNPLNIRDFEDLARPGVEVIQPDPATSGSALWVLLAEFGAGQRRSGRWNDGGDLLVGIARNVTTKAGSALDARMLFEKGMGDALVTLEQDALYSRRNRSLDADLVYPRSTIVSEPCLVVIERGIEPRNQREVDALVQFLWSERAQRIFAEYGYRGIETGMTETDSTFQRIEDPFRIEDFGGWKHAKREVIDGVWRNRVLRERRP